MLPVSVEEPAEGWARRLNLAVCADAPRCRRREGAGPDCVQPETHQAAAGVVTRRTAEEEEKEGIVNSRNLLWAQRNGTSSLWASKPH